MFQTVTCRQNPFLVRRISICSTKIYDIVLYHTWNLRFEQRAYTIYRGQCNSELKNLFSHTKIYLFYTYVLFIFSHFSFQVSKYTQDVKLGIVPISLLRYNYILISYITCHQTKQLQLYTDCNTNYAIGP